MRGTRYVALVPNSRGLDRALAAGVREIAVFGSATETFAQRNLAQSLDGQFEMFAPVVAAAGERGIRVRGYLSVQSLHPHAYSESQLEFLRVLASYTAIALENARSFARLDRVCAKA